MIYVKFRRVKTSDLAKALSCRRIASWDDRAAGQWHEANLIECKCFAVEAHLRRFRWRIAPAEVLTLARHDHDFSTLFDVVKMMQQSRPPKGTSDTTHGALEVLISFGASMWRAGNTAIRTREWLEVLAKKMGFDAIAVGLSPESITVSARSSNRQITAMHAVAPQMVNAHRIAELEELARAVEPGFALSEAKARMAAIEAVPPLYSRAQIAGAVALASGSFAFLNGAGGLEIIATAIGGGVGQWFRQFLSHRQLNQYGAAALTAILASGTYVLVTALAGSLGFGFAHYPIGFIASVLFLVPGFPADRRPLRSSAIANGRRHQPPRKWCDDFAGRGPWPQYCHRLGRSGPLTTGSGRNCISNQAVHASFGQLRRWQRVFIIVQHSGTHGFGGRPSRVIRKFSTLTLE